MTLSILDRRQALTSEDITQDLIFVTFVTSESHGCQGNRELGVGDDGEGGGESQIPGGEDSTITDQQHVHHRAEGRLSCLP